MLWNYWHQDPSAIGAMDYRQRLKNARSPISMG
jgi:hypothetical protein